MTTVYLALGSNVGETRGHIEQAIKLLGDILRDIKQAPLYKTKAVGYTDQADFLNTAISGQTSLGSEELLSSIKEIEWQLGRVERFRWGPREIDIDIIFYGNQVLESENLALPHPAFRDRDFVLRPLADLSPDLIDPVTGQTISQLLAGLSANQKSIIARVDQKA
jgi:2-amino-4-hydroxy-6-hydroxymethyldihydropteridine diphosphokinase